MARLKVFFHGRLVRQMILSSAAAAILVQVCHVGVAASRSRKWRIASIRWIIGGADGAGSKRAIMWVLKEHQAGENHPEQAWNTVARPFLTQKGANLGRKVEAEAKAVLLFA